MRFEARIRFREAIALATVLNMKNTAINSPRDELMAVWSKRFRWLGVIVCGAPLPQPLRKA